MRMNKLCVGLKDCFFLYIVSVIVLISYSAAFDRDFGIDTFCRILFWPVFIIIIGIKEIIKDIKG